MGFFLLSLFFLLDKLSPRHIIRTEKTETEPLRKLQKPEQFPYL